MRKNVPGVLGLFGSSERFCSDVRTSGSSARKEQISRNYDSLSDSSTVSKTGKGLIMIISQVFGDSMSDEFRKYLAD